MSNTHVSNQFKQLIFLKHIANHAISLALIQASLRPIRNNSSRVLIIPMNQKEHVLDAYLSAMLKDGETLVELATDILALVGQQSRGDPTHLMEKFFSITLVKNQSATFVSADFY